MGTSLDFRPVTKASWPDFEAFFESRGAPKYCWCMVWRATEEEGRGTTGPVRKVQMKGRIERGVPVGLLAYRDEMPVAWVSVAPRDSYRRLGGPPEPEGGVVWSLVCMFIKRPHRGQGLTRDLIRGAMAHARAEGATVLEAYPVAPDAPSYGFMGRVPVFEALGFTHFGMQGKRRHVMRVNLALR